MRSNAHTANIDRAWAHAVHHLDMDESELLRRLHEVLHDDLEALELVADLVELLARRRAERASAA